GATVLRGGVRYHAEAIGDRLEGLGLFMYARLTAPPGALVHEGTVSRVHQAYNAIVDGAIQKPGKMNQPIWRRWERQWRHIRDSLVWLLRVWDEHPDIAIPFTANISRDADLVHVNRGVFGQCRNPLAPARLIKLPPMVRTLDTVAFHLSKGQ